MKGRHNTPSNIVELRGGTKHTHKKAKTDDPQPEKKIPEMPAHLNSFPEAVKEWARVSELLYSNGIMTELERNLLADYCFVTHRIYMLAELMVTSGWDATLQKTNYKGENIGLPETKQNEYNKEMDKKIELRTKLGNLLGLDQIYRPKMKAEKPKEKSKIEEFRQKKRQS